MAEIRLTRRAISELMEIKAESIQVFGQIVADKYLEDIEDALNTLSEYPRLLREQPFADHARFYTVRKHVLVFAVLDDMLYLLTMKYGGMDIEDIITRLEPTLILEAQVLRERLNQGRRKFHAQLRILGLSARLRESGNSAPGRMPHGRGIRASRDGFTASPALNSPARTRVAAGISLVAFDF